MAWRNVKWSSVGVLVFLAFAAAFTDRQWLAELLGRLPGDGIRFAVGVVVGVGWSLPLYGAYLVRRSRGGPPVAAGWPAVLAALLLAVFVVAFPYRTTDYAGAVDRLAPGLSGGVLLGGLLFLGLGGMVLLLERRSRSR